MKRTPITPDLSGFPQNLRPILEGAPLYDSSCSPAAKVIFIDREEGYYLKSAAPGTLAREAQLTGYFHSKGLSAEVLCYLSDQQDWLLTRRVPGEDCTHADYLADPIRLADLLGQRLRALHEINPAGCPVPHRTAEYLAAARENYRLGRYDSSLFPDNWGYDTPEAAIAVVNAHGHLLKTDVLLHGDYCLPNLLLDNWRFTGFIDLGNGGVGDRHIDLFWGAWSLSFNLSTDRYRDRFLDAYGRDKIDPDLFPVIAAAEVFG